MRLLIFPVIICVAVSSHSCAPAGPLTPRDAFHRVRRACESDDAKTLSRLISSESRAKIGGISDLFGKMDRKQLEAAAKSYGVPQEWLQDMTVEDFFSVFLAREKGDGFLCRAVRGSIVSMEAGDREATIRVENGATLRFVREGSFWRFDFREF